MKYPEIKQVVKDLSKSQGFYCRVLERMEEIENDNPTAFGDMVEELESQNFSDAVDVVMYFES